MAGNEDDVCILIDIKPTSANIPFGKDNIYSDNKVCDELCILDADIPEMSDVAMVQTVSNSNTTSQIVSVESNEVDKDDELADHEVGSEEFVWADDPTDDDCILHGPDKMKPGVLRKHKKKHADVAMADDLCILEDNGCQKYSSLSSVKSEDVCQFVKQTSEPNAPYDYDDFTEFESAEDCTPPHLSSGTVSGKTELDDETAADDLCILKAKIKKRDLRLSKDGDSKCILVT